MGHDGMEITKPELEKPFCYRSFTTFEFNEKLYPLGFTFTEMLKEYCDISKFMTNEYNYIVYNPIHCEGYFYTDLKSRLSDIIGIILVDYKSTI